jgi:primosomal protein N'
MSITAKIKERLKRGREFIFVQPEQANQRIAICNTCDQLSGIRNCKQCGCFIDAKAKLQNASCPIGKW